MAFILDRGVDFPLFGRLSILVPVQHPLLPLFQVLLYNSLVSSCDTGSGGILRSGMEFAYSRLFIRFILNIKTTSKQLGFRIPRSGTELIKFLKCHYD